MIARYAAVLLGAWLVGWSALCSAQGTAEILLRHCGEMPVPGNTSQKELAMFGKCIGYIEGANDMLTLLMETFGPGRYCPPAEGVSVDQARRIVIKWIKDHPEKMHETPRLVVLDALMQAFPCRASTTTQPAKSRPKAR